LQKIKSGITNYQRTITPQIKLPVLVLLIHYKGSCRKLNQELQTIENH